MSVKICPKCKFANKYVSKNCVQCNFLFPPLTGPTPDRNRASIRRIHPKQLVKCPHCNSEIHIHGLKWKCQECRRYFVYYGPFQIECQGCGNSIALTIKSRKEIVSCPDCRQKYRLDLPPTRSNAEEWARVGVTLCC